MCVCAFARALVCYDLFIWFRTLSHNLNNYSSGKFQMWTICHEIAQCNAQHYTHVLRILYTLTKGRKKERKSMMEREIGNTTVRNLWKLLSLPQIPYFLCATECLLLISLLLYLSLGPIIFARDLNSSRFQFYFQLLINHNISFRFMLLMIVWLSSRLWIYVHICDACCNSCCVAIYGKWICFCSLRAFMCKPLNNHKNHRTQSKLLFTLANAMIYSQTTDNSASKAKTKKNCSGNIWTQHSATISVGEQSFLRRWVKNISFSTEVLQISTHFIWIPSKICGMFAGKLCS